jgi:nitrous oxidase accessory protein NosD
MREPGGGSASVAEPPDAPAAFVKRGPTGTVRQEAEVLQRVDHPGVVRLLDWADEGGAGRLRLGYVEGQDLEAMIRASGGTLEPARAVGLIAALAEAVEAIHAAGFLHRDLKPANVRVRPDGAPVIVDLGASAPIEGQPAAGQRSWLTHGYAAPEQYLDDGPEGPWTDVYALGAIAWRALTGNPPPAAPARLLGTPLPRLQVAGLSPALAGAIEAALALEPAARPDSARRLRALLEDAEAGGDDFPPTVEVERVARRVLAARPPARDIELRPARRKTGWLSVLLLVALLAGALGAGFWYGRPVYERFVKRDWLVDPAGGGDAITIGDALRRSGEGASIRIAPGTYPESLRLEHAVELRPAEPETPPLIAPEDGPCAVIGQPGSALRGLELRSASADPDLPCVDVAAEAQVEGNTITSRSGPAIQIDGGAAPAILDNQIEDSRIGLLITGGASGEIGGNTIRGGTGPAVVIRGGARPTVRDNTLEGSGVVFAEGAGGLFEGNRVLDAAASGVVVTSGAEPVVRNNQIERPGDAAIYVYEQGGGVIDGNTIVDAGVSGVVVAAGGHPRLAGNTIEASGEHGILVVEGGSAVIEANTIRGSAGHGIAIGPGAEVELSENQLSENGKEPPVLDGRDETDEGS